MEKMVEIKEFFDIESEVNQLLEALIEKIIDKNRRDVEKLIQQHEKKIKNLNLQLSQLK